jgi:hypothetical protein
MRKLFALALAASTLVVAALPGGAAGRHTLAHRVSTLEGKMNCLRRAPVTQFVDYAWFGLFNAPSPANPSPDFTNYDPNDPSTYPFAPSGLALNNWGNTTGLDLAYGFTPDVWMLAVRNTSTCRRRFPRLANPNPARVSTRLQAARLASLE